MYRRFIANILLGALGAAYAASAAYAQDAAPAETPPASQTAAPADATPAAPTSGRSDYILQPGDLIRVIVFQETDLTLDVRVSTESTVRLPLIGSVDLKGKTPRDAQETIRKAYDADYLVNPQINVMVTEYSRRSVNVIGSVNTPGAVQFPQEEGMTLLDAITRAGGFSRLADKKRLKLTRTNPSSGKLENYTIDAEKIIEGSAREQWVLLKDDVIFVPERVI